MYFLLLRGWARSGKYSVLGGYRSSAQAISYEVVLLTCFLIFIVTIIRVNVRVLCFFQYFYSLGVLIVGVLFCWVLSCLAECNRSPFDFSEGESELVSGFNTEYGGGMFSLIFIGEYRSILFFRVLTGLLFWGGNLLYLFSIFIFVFYLWARGSYPRLRYDKLIKIAWRGVLIYLMGVLLVFFC